MKFHIMQYLPFPDRSVRVDRDIFPQILHVEILDVSHAEIPPHDMVISTTALSHGGTCCEV